MTAKIIITVTQGKLQGMQYIFEERTTCIIGRAKDCNPKLPSDKEHSTISRYHCLLDINPPQICIRDFGSKNGTYVNSKKIGQRLSHQTPEEGRKSNFKEYNLHSGDEIKLGQTVFKVNIGLDRDIAADSVLNKRIPAQPQNLLENLKSFLYKREKNQDYTLVRLLGKGGCGEVYLAKDNQSNEFVALKVMLPDVAVSKRAVKMFLREIENTKVLQHPNVVKLIDYSYSNGLFYFTMEYCQGGSLFNLIRNNSKLSVETGIIIILQILEGLEYTHNVEIPQIKLADGRFGKGKGLVHRDLKPGNIFIKQENNQLKIKIGDYGLSKAFDLAGLSGQTFTGAKAGTPFFVPRQQLLDFKYVQPEVDVWAAVACLYNMLTGTCPRDLTGDDTFLDVLENDPVPIRQRDASIPKKLAEVIDLALIEKPEIHFKSAAAFKRALLSVI